MSSFFKKFKKDTLIAFLVELGDTVYKSKWKKAELIEQIEEYGPKKYCPIMTKEQLIIGLKFHKEAVTGTKNTLKKRLIKRLDKGQEGHTIGSDANKDVEYTILVENGRYTCTCADFHYRGHIRPCKHINRIREKIEAEGGFTDEAEVVNFKHFPQKTRCLIIGNTHYQGSPLKTLEKMQKRFKKY